MAAMLRVPLLTLDMGAVFTGVVGGSEQRVREALQLAEECAPCVVRIEEIEKALSGSGSSNMSDGGTTNRVFQTILNWLQEKDSPVYVVATANSVEQLPPELLRKGRFDEIFFVDLPVESERVEIFKIHLRKWAGLTEEQIDTFDTQLLASRTENFSGAEIEALIKDSLYTAVSEHEAAGTLADFCFTDTHICDTIGVGGVRTFRILYDSESRRLNELRNMARTSWANASTHDSEPISSNAGSSVDSTAISNEFFDSDETSFGALDSV
jgi:SpoVK/Ycf46/Vps4 family AAA+-type ATPase